jgi:hypothetical protein
METRIVFHAVVTIRFGMEDTLKAEIYSGVIFNPEIA